ncbi:MAG TPA: DUF885 domain-containing protein [Croceibacterium sp.]|nr:DUF885 domain-containing protein [Croceibacterium sp.]
MNRRLAVAGGALALVLAAPAVAQETPAWIERSNEYTMQLLEMDAQFSPEGAAQTGLEQYDGLAMDIGPDLSERYAAAARAQLAEFEAAQARESDPLLKQDLQILIDSLEQSIEGTELSDRLTLDWYDIPRTVFGVMNGLLDDQIAPARRQTAKVLLERYTGLHPGSISLAEQGRARWAESLGPGKVGPYKGSVEDTLGKTDTYIAGIRELFTRFQIEGADAALDAMERQLRDYAEWERTTVLPAAREDFRLPPEIYAYRLKTVGIDLPPEQLIARARREFYSTRQQMEALAPLVAARLGYAATDYPSVIAELKKDKIAPERMEAHYAEVLGQIQEIAGRERIVSLPDYPVLMRLGTEAENAASPAPHMRPPRLIGNTGERGTFVLTTAVSPVPGEEPNDFNFGAAAWTLSVHEGRPGHELQFAQMVERGVSQARVLYAFNSVNVEGWALYAEAEMLPYEPLEGQLIALQHRLLRASRTMLDPMLNLGLTDMATAERVLREEARFSPSMVKQEVDRYTFRAPGQAGSYFYGYSQLIDLRTETELALGDKFDRMAFNDFIVGQGLLPIGLLREAVREQFIPAQQANGS